MENVVFTQLSIPELRIIFRQELENYFASKSKPEADQLLTIQEAAEFLKLTVPTIYSKVSKGEIPVMKRSKRLYFSKQELTEWIKAGRENRSKLKHELQ